MKPYDLNTAQDTYSIGGVPVAKPTGSNNGHALVFNASSNKLEFQDVTVPRAIAFFVAQPRVVTGIESFIMPTNMTIQHVQATLDQAAVGADFVVDVLVNGQSIFTTTAKPTIAAGQTVLNPVIPDNLALAAGDKVSLSINQIGTTSPGQNLALSVICQ